MTILSEKILVVDGEALLRRSLRAFLENLGYEVLEADRGESGLEICLREHPDLVLLDISLSGKNGFELCRKLQAYPEAGGIPVVFLCGLMEARDKLEAFASGGVDYLNKPFQFEEVQARIFTHLELRRLRRAMEASQKHLAEALAEVRTDQHLLLEVNERLSQSEAIQGHFIEHMRNEINDPLGSILGLAEEICDPRLSGEQARALASRIKTEAFKLDFQFQNIFCAADLEAGEASLSIALVDVDSVIKDTVVAFEERIREKAQVLEVHVPGEAKNIATDAGKLRLILANLLANAIEFSPERGRIGIWVQRQEEALVIQVRDNGIGFNQADAPKIFDRFRQLDAGITRAHHGQGLGLSVVKALVELLDGEVAVVSELGCGSTFTFRLPLGPQTGNPDAFGFDGNLTIFDEPREL